MEASSDADASSETNCANEHERYVISSEQSGRETSPSRTVLCHLSGNNWKAEAFRQRLQKSMRSPGDTAPQNSAQATCQDGNYIVVKGTLIPFSLL